MAYGLLQERFSFIFGVNDADVLCIQETKAQDDQWPKLYGTEGYRIYSSSAVRKGYWGDSCVVQARASTRQLMASVFKDMIRKDVLSQLIWFYR